MFQLRACKYPVFAMVKFRKDVLVGRFLLQENVETKTLMGKNIIIQQKTQDRYEELYPKVSSDQDQEGLYKIGDIKYTVRDDLSDNWKLCDGSYLETETSISDNLIRKLEQIMAHDAPRTSSLGAYYTNSYLALKSSTSVDIYSISNDQLLYSCSRIRGDIVYIDDVNNYIITVYMTGTNGDTLNIYRYNFEGNLLNSTQVDTSTGSAATTTYSITNGYEICVYLKAGKTNKYAVAYRPEGSNSDFISILQDFKETLKTSVQYYNNKYFMFTVERLRYTNDLTSLFVLQELTMQSTYKVYIKNTEEKLQVFIATGSTNPTISCYQRSDVTNLTLYDSFAVLGSFGGIVDDSAVFSVGGNTELRLYERDRIVSKSTVASGSSVTYQQGTNYCLLKYSNRFYLYRFDRALPLVDSYPIKAYIKLN